MTNFDGYLETVLETIYDARNDLTDKAFGVFLDRIKSEVNKMKGAQNVNKK